MCVIRSPFSAILNASGASRRVGFSQLKLADMHVERQTENFGEALRQLQRAGAVVADGVAFQIAKPVPVLLGKIEPTRDRDIAQGADVALDEVEAEKTHRPNERADVKIGFERVHDRHELVERVDPRTAGLDKRRHALIHADAVGVGEAERAISVDVNVDPSGREIAAGKIYDLCLRIDGSLTDRLDFPSAITTSATRSIPRCKSITWAFLRSSGGSPSCSRFEDIVTRPDQSIASLAKKRIAPRLFAGKRYAKSDMTTPDILRAFAPVSSGIMSHPQLLLARTCDCIGRRSHLYISQGFDIVCASAPQASRS